MKKRLEAELISIAHRVLKLKNKSEVDQLFIETQKLYEALSVLKFYGDYIEHSEPEINQEDLEEKLADSLEGKKAPALDKEAKEDIIKEAKEIVPVDEESAPDPIAEEPHTSDGELPKHIVGEINAEDDDDAVIEEEPVAEEEPKEELHADPIFEMASEAPIEEEPNDNEQEEQKEEAKEIATRGAAELSEAKPQKQISFEDFLGDNYGNLEFVKPNDTSQAAVPKEETKEEEDPITPEPIETKPEIKEEKNPILNESRGGTSDSELAKQSERSEAKVASGINIGLNDRVGFVKYLFDDSSEDFNRVLSQLNTFDSLSEAKEFINDMVKPDYNNWKGNEDYAERFMEIVEQKFK